MLSQSPRLFLMAGEVSGDLLGARLMDSLRLIHPQAEFWGVGGEEMRQRGLHLERPTEEFCVMGFVGIPAALPRLTRQFYYLRRRILELQPDLVCLIDYPEFNIRLARSLRRQGYRGKIVQYVCPTVWAWGKRRIRIMEPHIDLVLSIYPFEPSRLRDTRLNLHYVGNPLAHSVRQYEHRTDWMQTYALDSERPILGLFPGSRPSEITLNFQTQLQAAKSFCQAHPDTQLVISVAHPKLESAIKQHLKTAKISDAIRVRNEDRYELMAACRASLATMGSVTMELALHRVPTVVSYQMRTLDRILAQYLLRIKLDYYCMANIIRGEEVFPELLAYHASAQRQLELLEPLFQDGPKRTRCLEQCYEVDTLLQPHDSSKNAAEKILELLTS